MGLCSCDIRDLRVVGFDHLVDMRVLPGNIYGEASDERQRGSFWVDRWCSYSVAERTQFLSVHVNLLSLTFCRLMLRLHYYLLRCLKTSVSVIDLNRDANAIRLIMFN
jgi:hypothetical protein